MEAAPMLVFHVMLTNSEMFRVRAATAADANALRNIFELCVTTADWLPTQARNGIDFALSSAGELIHVAIARNGDVVGFVSVQVAESFVHHLYVHPTIQGQGVGRLLLSSLESWLAVPWRLKCVCTNRLALSFYMVLGWREVGAGESADGPYAVLEWQRSSTSIASNES